VGFTSVPFDYKVWQEVRPARLDVVKLKLKRAFYLRRNSADFISGDLFADNADFQAFPPKFRSLPNSKIRLCDARVIFCPSDRLQEFLIENMNIIHAKVIICGNSDYEFHKVPTHIPKSIKHFFLQNSFISDFKMFSPLPIGIENLRFARNGFPNLMNQNFSWEEKEDRILVGPFGLTHTDRNFVVDKFELDNNLIEIIPERLEPEQYARLMGKFRYVAAVRGNGVDTHRHWESLYRGSIPFVLNDSWSTSMKFFGFPFVLLEEWSSSAIKERLQTSLVESTSIRLNERLWWPFWRELINSYV
jgi:hypothetical protein